MSLDPLVNRNKARLTFCGGQIGKLGWGAGRGSKCTSLGVRGNPAIYDQRKNIISLETNTICFLTNSEVYKPIFSILRVILRLMMIRHYDDNNDNKAMALLAERENKRSKRHFVI